jgi:hypothetical protein
MNNQEIITLELKKNIEGLLNAFSKDTGLLVKDLKINEVWSPSDRYEMIYFVRFDTEF